MRVKHRYAYEAKASLVNFLRKKEIPYEINDVPGTTKKICTFDLYEDQESYRKFGKLFFLLSEYDLIKYRCTIDTSDLLAEKKKGRAEFYDILDKREKEKKLKDFVIKKKKKAQRNND